MIKYDPFENMPMSKEAAENIDRVIMEEYEDRIEKPLTPEELEERKRKTEEDYNKMAQSLNRKYKNPSRAIERKHTNKEKFGKNILNRMNAVESQKKKDSDKLKGIYKGK